MHTNYQIGGDEGWQVHAFGLPGANGVEDKLPVTYFFRFQFFFDGVFLLCACVCLLHVFSFMFFVLLCCYWLGFARCGRYCVQYSALPLRPHNGFFIEGPSV